MASVLGFIPRAAVREGYADFLDAVDLPHDEKDILSLTITRNELSVEIITGVNVDWEGRRTPETVTYKYKYSGQ